MTTQEPPTRIIVIDEHFKPRRATLAPSGVVHALLRWRWRDIQPDFFDVLWQKRHSVDPKRDEFGVEAVSRRVSRVPIRDAADEGGVEEVQANAAEVPAAGAWSTRSERTGRGDVMERRPDAGHSAHVEAETLVDLEEPDELRWYRRLYAVRIWQN